MSPQMDAFAAGVVDVIKKALQPRDERLAALERRIAVLESVPKGLAYAGTWQRAAEYQRHAGTTHKSQL